VTEAIRVEQSCVSCIFSEPITQEVSEAIVQEERCAAPMRETVPFFVNDEKGRASGPCLFAGIRSNPSEPGCEQDNR
jgi:hypothetical protein